MSSPPFLVVERIEVAWTNRGEGGGRIVGRWRRRGGLGVDIEGGSGVGDVCGGGSRRVLERKKKIGSYKSVCLPFISTYFRFYNNRMAQRDDTRLTTRWVRR